MSQIDKHPPSLYLLQFTAKNKNQLPSTPTTATPSQMTMATPSTTMSTASQDKRPVAKKACLACRDKKIKCDGEIPPPNAPSTTTNNGKTRLTPSYKKCSNCLAAGIDCVFVKSNRGGRRKKGAVSEIQKPLNLGSNPSAKALQPNTKRPRTASSNENFTQRHQQHGPPPPPGPPFYPPSNMNYHHHQNHPPSLNLPPPTKSTISVSPGTSQAGSSFLLPPLRDNRSSLSDTRSDSSSSSQETTSSSYNYANYFPPPYSHGYPPFSPGPPGPYGPHGRPHGRPGSPGPPGGHFRPGSPGPRHHHRHGRGRGRGRHGMHHLLPPPPFGYGPPGPPPHGFPPVPPHLMHGFPPPPPPPAFMFSYDQQQSVTKQSSVSQDKASTILPLDSVSQINKSPPSKSDDYDGSTEHWVREQQNNTASEVKSSSSSSLSKEKKSTNSVGGTSSEKIKNTCSIVELCSNNDVPQILSKSSHTASSVFEVVGGIKESELINIQLAHYGLPNIRTVNLLIAIFFKYVHPSHLVLPNKNLFIEKFSISNDSVAVLASMFSVAIRFISPNEINDCSILNEKYWLDIVEKYRDDLSLHAELLTMTLTCRHSNDDQLKRCYNAIENGNLLKVLEPKSNQELNHYLEAISLRQLVDKENLTRLVWNVYKFQTFRRISFGFPFTENAPFKFPETLELPVNDIDYYINSTNLQAFKDQYIKKTISLNQIDFKSPSQDVLYNALAVILSVRSLDQIMDSISREALIPENIIKFDSQISNLNKSDCLKPYVLINDLIVIDSNLLLAKMINSLSGLILHYSLSKDLILIKPKTSEVVNSNVNLMNDFPNELPVQSDLPALTPSPETSKKFRSIISQLTSSLEIIQLIELAEGMIPESLTYNKIFKTTLGPATISSNEKSWYSVDDKFSKVTNVPLTNETWIQYPQFCSTIVASNCVPILCSLILIWKKFNFSLDKSKVLIKDENKDMICEVEYLDVAILENMEKIGAFKDHNEMITYLLEKLRLLNRYLSSLSRYYGEIKLANFQIDKLIDHMLDVGKD